MRIALLTTGRFHLCDLARELTRLGHDVLFYSLVPPWRTARFGLPRRCNRWLAPYVAPLLAAARVMRRRRVYQVTNWALTAAVDRIASKLIEPCDVFVGMSNVCLATIQRVRQKYGARIYLERGSRHILSQKEILDALQGNDGAGSSVPDWAVARELEEYELADVIVVPSQHALESFVERGVPVSRLMRNPYGVDLAMFPPTEAPVGSPRKLLMVGVWSKQKGCDVLAEAWRQLPNTILMHVGALGDALLPSEQGFEHCDPVPQESLTRFYSRAHVFALASRQEGLALVQAQALASGLPIVCTTRTGGADLREFVDDPSAISIVRPDDVAALSHALDQALERAGSVSGLRDLLKAGRERLSWKAYGRRYHEALLSHV